MNFKYILQVDPFILSLVVFPCSVLLFERGVHSNTVQEVNISSLDEMESAVWSRLPQDLLERVVVKLAEGDVMKMRRVSQHWNSTICSFCRLRPPSLADGLLLCPYVQYPDHLALKWINRRTGSWDMRLLPLCEFHGGDYFGQNLLLNSRSELRPFEILKSILASDGGVLCFEFPYRVQDIVLGNPLTKCWRKLPRLIPHEPAYTWRVAGMSVNKHTGHHIIVCMGFFNDRRQLGYNRLKATQVYDSSVDSWSLFHQPTPLTGRIIHMSMVNQVVFTDDYIYLLTSPSLGLQVFLQIFSMRTKTWAEVPVTEGSIDKYFHGSACLITLQDEIYLVADEKELGTHYLSLWKLDTSNIEDLWTHTYERNVKITWHRGNRIEFDALTAMTSLPIQRFVFAIWGCVVHERKICFLFPAGYDMDVYGVFIEHDMGTDSWRLMDVDQSTYNRNLWSFEPSYASVFPEVHSLVVEE